MNSAQAYLEYNLDWMLEKFASDITPTNPNTRIVSKEVFLDLTKRKVIVKLTTVETVPCSSTVHEGRK